MKNILIVTDYFYPAFKAGGPVKSLKNLINKFETLGGYKFEVVTSNRDIDGTILSTDKEKLPFNLNLTNINYFSRVFDLFYYFLSSKEKKKFDIVYLNSFFSFKFSILFIFFSKLNLFETKQLLVAPRGELTRGAMSLKKVRKRFYCYFFRCFKIKKIAKFHFTSQEEVDDAFFFLGEVDYILVPNMHDPIPNYIKKDKTVGTLNVIFLSRISKKKNLLTLCKALTNLDLRNGKVNFKIAGNIEDNDYWQRCLKVLNKSNNNLQYEYLGALKPVEVKNTLSESHVFALPTLNENYGHAIVEAMALSNLVLISDQTPWSKVRDNGSFVFKVNDVDYISNCIKLMINLDAEQYAKRSSTTYDYISNILINNESLVEGMFND
ncbi:glycosyltransferase [Pseudoalteromonas sp. SG41-1]|uniref:glycosyltransferase n=1 Tax=Pseudoalteromonas sp. SG41-1 TaxID=2760979 RepID=UPI001604317F|nr:glycosyltransferase [Pseudoalteromonas sp. SG41-1]MBB1507799.1 glycosyltransferase [Pseudoalteromonas sp. SG41-1]